LFANIEIYYGKFNTYFVPFLVHFIPLPCVRENFRAKVERGFGKFMYLCGMKTVKDLCRFVEDNVGREIKTPKDFDWLASRIVRRTRTYLSPTTLKRTWGYIKDEHQQSRTTLDALARFVGYTDWVEFESQADEVQSNPIVAPHLRTIDLAEDTLLQVRWQPNRQCLFLYLGEGKFVVRESLNSKLHVGDTFSCNLFIEREPLYLNNVVHDGRTMGLYVAGKKGGITFQAVKEGDLNSEAPEE